MKSQLIGKDPDAGKDWGQEEKGATEDKIAGWDYQLNRQKCEQTQRERQWKTEKSGVLQSTGLQRVGHNWANEQQEIKKVPYIKI